MWGRPLFSAIIASASACVLASCSPAGEVGPVVLAASSMQEGLTAAADDWAALGHARPVLSFASSSAVARQLEEGAPADLVVTSDDRWIEWLADRGALSGDPVPLVGNELVVVAPLGDEPAKSLAEFASDHASGRLAMGDPESVPAGEFARAALQHMGLWDALSNRLAPGENVRASLALVERGEAALGIVYASDAEASDAVRAVQRIDPQAHPAIVYYVARAANSQHDEAQDFLAYLVSTEGRAPIMAKGFTLP